MYLGSNAMGENGIMHVWYKCSSLMLQKLSATLKFCELAKGLPRENKMYLG